MLGVVVREDVVDAQPARPRIDQPLLGPFEVVLDVALPAHERAHLLARGVAVDVVVLHALAGLQRAHALEERRPVARSCMVSGAWQSMHATGCDTSARASAY